MLQQVDRHEDKVKEAKLAGDKKDKKKKKKDKAKRSGPPVSLDGLMDWTAKGI